MLDTVSSKNTQYLYKARNKSGYFKRVHLPCFNQIQKSINNQQTHFFILLCIYSQYFHRHVLTGIQALQSDVLITRMQMWILWITVSPSPRNKII